MLCQKSAPNTKAVLLTLKDIRHCGYEYWPLLSVIDIGSFEGFDKFTVICSTCWYWTTHCKVSVHMWYDVLRDWYTDSADHCRNGWYFQESIEHITDMWILKFMQRTSGTPKKGQRTYQPVGEIMSLVFHRDISLQILCERFSYFPWKCRQISVSVAAEQWSLVHLYQK